jgi:4-methyl-5(b-hydroxyethyl)-thiazole monophosphate biosynthesis
LVYVFLADGVNETEAVSVTDCLRRAGIETRTVGVTGMTVTGARGMKLLADIPLEEVPTPRPATSAAGGRDVLLLPGGLQGVENLSLSERVRELVADAMEAGAPVGAICAAPRMLADMGLIKGRTVTCYPSVADKVKEGGAYVLDRPWVREGNLITGQGPGASLAFGTALAAMLLGEKKADWLAGQLLISRH